MTFANWAIGVKSSTPRKGIWGISAGFIACVLTERTSGVYPPGLAWATTAEPIFPEAPALLSTITGCPRDFPSRSASARAKISVEPPAAHGPIKVPGFSGGMGKGRGQDSGGASRSPRNDQGHRFFGISGRGQGGRGQRQRQKNGTKKSGFHGPGADGSMGRSRKRQRPTA